jgi:type I restriction enzyme R subunit
MTKANERTFQNNILASLEAQGWLVGHASQYDRENALYPEDLVGYQQDAWPERWEKFCQSHPANPERELVRLTARELARRDKGTLYALRHGFRVPGTKIDLCSFKPDHGMNPDTERRYGANRLRVVEEVSYSPHAKESGYNPRLDLVLFVNGIPVATLELKSEAMQSIENAKRQYQYDRPLQAPNRKAEPLLAFRRGALVHFAVTQNEVAMTTKLAGAKTFFLPFNQGTPEGGAGNPRAEDPGTYATAYLWEEIFLKDNLLRIIARYMHLEEKREEDFHGRVTVKETMIFPRYHQWSVVNSLINSTRNEGPGQRYLVQHSAGSGKSNSIAWTAHQLANLYTENGTKLFSSVIVITDRTVLDSQLQDTIYQFEHAEGVVRRITDSGGSKSGQLAEALAAQAPIIVVTIQTFPALFAALEQHPQLAQGNYAVIADEAHSSQTGSSATKLKNVLSHERSDEEFLSAEDALTDRVASRKPTEKISYYAFTATPKARTIELFGREPNPDLPRGEDNLPGPFHLYSMRQAIEEGFILDVLQNYTTYSTAWKLAHPDDDDKVDSSRAKKTIAKWLRLHPHNIGQKVEIIVEHFRTNVIQLLDGHAKAMVVTGSRPEAVRYQLAIQQYIAEQGYKDVHALVAFSGSVPADDVIPEEVTETSPLLNPGLHGRDHAEAFDTTDFNVMIVANKFQTGFDQPKLCAMYVDKKLDGVSCVQTLSRLNRLFPGKQTFILDFFNTEEDILHAFLPYYEQARLSDVTDPQVVYDLFDTLAMERIYEWSEVDQFAKAFFDPKESASALDYYIHPAKDRYRKRFLMLKDEHDNARNALKNAEAAGDERGVEQAKATIDEIKAGIGELQQFRKNLRSFVRVYEFMSQIVFYDDQDLEKLCVYARHLEPHLRDENLHEDDIDIAQLELTHYRLTKQKESAIRLGGGEGSPLDPPVPGGGSGPRTPEEKTLSEIVDGLNKIYGTEIQSSDQVQFAMGIAQKIIRQDDVMLQLDQHSPEQAMHGLYPNRVSEALLESMVENQTMVTSALESDESFKEFAWVLMKMLKEPDIRERLAQYTL